MESAPQAFTILVVDDNPGLITLINKYLHREGFNSVVVHTGTEAIAWLTHNHADLMLLDLQLSDMNGEKLVETLEQQNRSLPFIVVTGHGDERLATKMMKSGARDYVVKDETLCELLPSVVTHTFEQLKQEQRLAEAEEALSAERERLAVTLASIADGVITTDTSGLITSMNQVAESQTGRKHRDAVGHPVGEIVHLYQQNNLTQPDHPVTQVLDTGNTLNPLHHKILIAHDGTERIVLSSAAPIRSQDGIMLGVVLVLRDMTDRVRIDQELLKASKLESLGTLAGGIAHDFNNLLTGILGNISLSKLVVNPDDQLCSFLTEAEKASMRAKSLTQQLLTFAEGGEPLKKPLSLGPMITESATFALRGSTTQCRCHLPESLWVVDGDKGQISQVIHNLVINAQQAMPTGGILTITGNNLTLSSQEAERTGPLPPGHYVNIVIEDEGMGIPQGFLPKIFDPYFTTKQSGSGLGLATAYSVIKNHGGAVTVSSELSRGTKFTIYLPASSCQQITQYDQEIPPKSGEGKILVMDDEESIRLLLQQMLLHLGYEVECAPDGGGAIDLYKKAKATQQGFSAVILDLTIPGGLGGKDTLMQLREIDPQVKAIVASGYSNDPVLSRYDAYGFHGVVAKPFRISELSDVLHRVTV